jgi:hypothetical protein
MILMVHHPTKSNPRSSRGGGAWESNVRLTINLVKMDENMGRNCGLSSCQEARERGFVMTSNDNYGSSPDPVYFLKDPETGIPRPINPGHITGELVKEWLLEALEEHGPVNRRLLQDNRPGECEVVANMLSTFPSVPGSKQDNTKDAVQALLDDDTIFEVKEGKSVLLTANRPAPDLKKVKGRRRRVFDSPASSAENDG